VSPFVDHFVDLKASKSAKEGLFTFIAFYYEYKLKKAISIFIETGSKDEIDLLLKKSD
jgi:hypothetical protein